MMADLAGARITADARMLGASWQDLAVPAARLRLAPTLLSGMSFRWRQRQSDGVFEGVLGTHAYELREAEDTVFFRVLTHPTGDAEARLRAHLSLERGVDVHTWQSRLRAPPPPCFVTAASSLVGVRVLTIDRLEAVVAFMGSANNNIKRNMQMVEALCAHFGEATRLETEPAHAGGGDAGPASTEGGPAAPSRFFRFPSVTQLCSLSLEELWALGWGYRAPRLHKLARQLAERGSEAFLDSLSSLPEEEARAKLCELSGVGRKVADCVLLFAYGHDGCVPVDTHCLQLAQTRLLPAIKGLSLTAAVYQRIVCRFHELFGAEHAGWAFMVLFVAELSDFKKMIARKQAEQAQAQAAVRAAVVEAVVEEIDALVKPRRRAQCAVATGTRAAGRANAELEEATPKASHVHSAAQPTEALPRAAARKRSAAGTCSRRRARSPIPDEGPTSNGTIKRRLRL